MAIIDIYTVLYSDSKKIIAVIFIVIIFIRALFISTYTASAMFAPAAGPAAASAIEAFIEAILAASGVSTQSDLNSMDFSQKESMLVNGLNDGSISKQDFIGYCADPRGYLDGKLLEFMTSDEVRLSASISGMIVSSWWNSVTSSRDNLYENLKPVGTADLLGFGACVDKVMYNPVQKRSFHVYVYCDYIVIDSFENDKIIQVTCYGNNMRYLSTDYSGSYDHDYVISGDSYVLDNSAAAFLNVTFKTYGDVRNIDGEPAEGYYGEEVYPDDNAVIGTASDGTDVTISDALDGVDTPVVPDTDSFDDSAIKDLLSDILDKLNDIADKEYDDSKELTESVVDSVGDVAIELEGLDGLTVPTSIVDVFPFCLPFDFVRGMYLFQAKPEVPEFTFDITVPSFLNVPEQHWKLDINLKDYEELAEITRWGFMILFVYNLIILTGKIVKGAGA